MPNTPKETAEHLFGKLQSDDQFEHVGRDSRSIALPTDLVTEKLQMLARDTIHPNAQAFLYYAVHMLQAIGDNGVLVRIKNAYDIELRGVVGELPENPSFDEINMVLFHFDNSIEIDLHGETPLLRIRAYTQDENTEEEVNGVIEQIPEQARIALIQGILSAVEEQFDQIFDA